MAAFACALLASVVVACGKSSYKPEEHAADAAPIAVAPLGGACDLPLAQFCGGAPCRDYDAEATALRSTIDGGCFHRAQLGTCGELRFVSRHDGFTGSTSYFDSKGALVAGERTSDTRSFCGRSFAASYGARPPCEKRTTADLCPDPTFGGGL